MEALSSDDFIKVVPTLVIRIPRDFITFHLGRALKLLLSKHLGHNRVINHFFIDVCGEIRK